MFWERWYPVALTHFPVLRELSLDDFMACIYRAEFSFIRVDADEATYDLHVLLRFEIELLLLRGELAVADLPGAWAERFEALFGRRPPDDTHGCLQDIHWSMGAFGYFPTYSLGNLGAAQLFDAALAQPDIRTAFKAANFAPLLAWLRAQVHHHGATLDPDDLIARATGSPPGPDAHLRHLRARYLGPAATPT